MDFKKAKPTSTRAAKGTPQGGQISFEVGLIEESNDRVRAPNALNSLFVVLIGMIVVLAPIPLGSNRPLPWAFWAVVAGAFGTLFFTSLFLRHKDRPLRFTSFWKILALACVAPLFALVQLLPIGGGLGLVPEGLATPHLTLSAPVTLFGVVRLCTYLIVFILTLEVCSRELRVRQLARIIFFGATAHAIYGLVALKLFGDIHFWGEKTSYLGFATGTFINRNSFATFLGMGAVTGLVLIFDRGTHRRQRRPDADSWFTPYAIETGIYWTCFGILFATVLLTGSRMGLAATLVAVLLSALMMRVKSARVSSQAAVTARSAFAMVAGGLFLGALFVVFGGEVGERAILTEQSAEGRLALYAQVVDLIASRPLTGYGLDSFALAFPLIHDASVPSGVTWDLAHNSYLTLWVELGLIAGSAPLIALAWIVWRLLREVRSRNLYITGPVTALGVITLGGIHSLADFSLEMEANALFFVVIVAMGLSQTGRDRREDTR